MARRAVTDVQALGAAVREVRTARGWTQAAVADRAGVSRQFVVNLERGADRAEVGRVLAVLRALGRGIQLERAGEWGAAAMDSAPALDAALARVLSSAGPRDPASADLPDEPSDGDEDDGDDAVRDRDADDRDDDHDDDVEHDVEEPVPPGGSIWGPP